MIRYVYAVGTATGSLRVYDTFEEALKAQRTDDYIWRYKLEPVDFCVVKGPK